MNDFSRMNPRNRNIMAYSSNIVSMANFAITGVAGYIAPRHLKAIADTGNRLVAAYDRFDSVGRLDSSFPDCAFFTEQEQFEAYLDRLKGTEDEVQWFVICTPNYTHIPYCRYALKNGMDVICEKPAALHSREIEEIAAEMNIPAEVLENTVKELHEFNPMMGHRGCRLTITYPEIAEMQTRAIIEAAINVSRSEGLHIVPEIMIPLVGEVKELKYVKEYVDATAKKVMEEKGMEIPYLVGTMIEIPRAALTADEIAECAEFFSFGTNDLTQMTFGFSRDDAGKFLKFYYDNKIFESDPFARLDQIGVGKLVEMAVRLGKKVRPNIKLGICGEHGGDPSTVEFCHNVGLNYVSCSPFRVPIARLAAAQANIKRPRG